MLKFIEYFLTKFMDKQTNFINIRYIKCYVFATQPSKRQHKNT